MRYWIEGGGPVKAGLEDYGLFASAPLALHEVDPAAGWLDAAERLNGAMVDLFYDAEEGRFYDAGRGEETLFIRERDMSGNDVPSGNSAAADLLFRMPPTSGGNRYREMSEGIMRTAQGMRDEPLSSGNFLCVLEDMLAAR